MKPKLFIVIAFLVFVLSLFASQTTITGVLTDDMCTKKHMMPGKANSDCVRDCIKHGAKYVVVSQGRTIELQGKHEELSDLAGKKVTVTGQLKGNVLIVANAEAAQ